MKIIVIINNSYRFSYEFTFILFLSFLTNQKQQSGFQRVGSSVKWGHLAHFEPNSTNTISLPILWGHLAHFEPGSVTTMTKNQNKN